MVGVWPPAKSACPIASTSNCFASYQPPPGGATLCNTRGCSRCRDGDAGTRRRGDGSGTSAARRPKLRRRGSPCSSLSSICCPSLRPVRVSHRGALMRSSTDVLSRNSLTPSGCRSRTSSARKSRTWRLLPEKASTKPETSSRSRIERAASWRAATQPSVTSSSARYVPRREGESHHVSQESGCFLCGEAQLGGPDLGHLVPGAQLGEGEGWVRCGRR